MSTGMRKWMEKDCPEIEYPPAQVLIDREELKQLLDRLEATEKDNALKEKLIDRLALELNSTSLKRDELRAKIEERERQEPVAWLHETRRDSDVVTTAVKHVRGKAVVGSMAAYSIPLYTLPGAKGEER